MERQVSRLSLPPTPRSVRNTKVGQKKGYIRYRGTVTFLCPTFVFLTDVPPLVRNSLPSINHCILLLGIPSVYSFRTYCKKVIALVMELSVYVFPPRKKPATEGETARGKDKQNVSLQHVKKT